MAVSIAWACTPQNGDTYLTTPDCGYGTPECSISRSTDDLAGFADNMTHPSSSGSDSNWKLYVDGGPWCMAAGGVTAITSAMTLSTGQTRLPSSGSVSGDISGIATGAYDVCFNNDNGGGMSSYPVSVTITS